MLALVKLNHMREGSQKLRCTRLKKSGSKNQPDMGIIRREGFQELR